jgi:hypothetical protein
MKRSHTVGAARGRRAAHASAADRVWRWLADGGAYLLLAAVLVLTLLALAVVFSRNPVRPASRAAATHTPNASLTKAPTTCGSPGLPACPDSQVQWIAITSQAPIDVMAAVKTSDLYTINAGGRGDTPSLARLGAPQLVTALVPPGAPAVPDYFDVPVLDASGAIVGVVLCELDQLHTMLAVVAIVQYAHPRTSGSIAQVGQQQAIADVASQQHVALRTGTQPRLIYFPFDFAAQETGQLNWVAGGESPNDPIWDVPGVDGQDHIVGSDNHVYYVSQLPIMGAGA